MPRSYTTRHIIKTLQNKGFYFVSQNGSHMKYKKKSSTGTLTVIVAVSRKEIPYGTFHGILFQSKLEKEDFD